MKTVLNAIINFFVEDGFSKLFIAFAVLMLSGLIIKNASILIIVIIFNWIGVACLAYMTLVILFMLIVEIIKDKNNKKNI